MNYLLCERKILNPGPTSIDYSSKLYHKCTNSSINFISLFWYLYFLALLFPLCFWSILYLCWKIPTHGCVHGRDVEKVLPLWRKMCDVGQVKWSNYFTTMGSGIAFCSNYRLGFQQGGFQVYSLPFMARLTRCYHQRSITKVGSSLFLAIFASEDNLTIWKRLSTKALIRYWFS